MRAFIIPAIFLFIRVLALENNKEKTPTLAWNSWYAVQCEGLNEEAIKRNALEIVRNRTKINNYGEVEQVSLKSMGFRTVIIDDCWASFSRDIEGNIYPDGAKFPSGMESLSRFLRSYGLNLGIYTTPGNFTCEKRVASGGHELRDIQTFISWNVDYIKYCVCNTTEEMRKTAYHNFSRLLLDKVYQEGYRVNVTFECDPFMDKPWDTLRSVCNIVSSGGDIEDSFDSWVQTINSLENFNIWDYSGPGHFALLDLLQIGNKGQTYHEYQAQISAYSILASPLIISTDLSNLTDDEFLLYANPSVIEINQDSLGIQGRKIEESGNIQVWLKPLINCKYAILFLNIGNATEQYELPWSHFANYTTECWINADKIVKIYDVWQSKFVLELATSSFKIEIDSHCGKLFMLEQTLDNIVEPSSLNLFNIILGGGIFLIALVCIISLLLAMWVYSKFKSRAMFSSQQTKNNALQTTEYELQDVNKIEIEEENDSTNIAPAVIIANISNINSNNRNNEGDAKSGDHGDTDIGDNGENNSDNNQTL